MQEVKDMHKRDNLWKSLTVTWTCNFASVSLLAWDDNLQICLVLITYVYKSDDIYFTEIIFTMFSWLFKFV